MLLTTYIKLWQGDLCCFTLIMTWAMWMLWKSEMADLVYENYEKQWFLWY